MEKQEGILVFNEFDGKFAIIRQKKARSPLSDCRALCVCGDVGTILIVQFLFFLVHRL